MTGFTNKSNVNSEIFKTSHNNVSGHGTQITYQIRNLFLGGRECTAFNDLTKTMMKSNEEQSSNATETSDDSDDKSLISMYLPHSAYFWDRT